MCVNPLYTDSNLFHLLISKLIFPLFFIFVTIQQVSINCNRFLKRDVIYINYYQVFNDMITLYGRQYWWPSDSDWETLVGAILVQNTNWKNAEKSLANLREKTGFKPDILLNVNLEVLKKLIKPSGFYNAKAKTIKNSLLFFESFGFDINKMKKTLSPKTLKTSLMNIKGIGNETSDVILLYIFDQPIFIIDKYARRMISRLEGRDVSKFKYQVLKEYMESNLQRLTYKDFQEYHALIDDYSEEYLRRLKNEK